jgi:hypothetical protein
MEKENLPFASKLKSSTRSKLSSQEKLALSERLQKICDMTLEIPDAYKEFRNIIEKQTFEKISMLGVSVCPSPARNCSPTMANKMPSKLHPTHTRSHHKFREV